MREKITLIENLPFVSVTIWHQGKSMSIDKVLIDTGSASTIFKIDLLEEIGLKPEDEDVIVSISGVGGSECVFLKVVDSIQIGDLKVKDFTIDIGIMDYGFEINGIIGMDFLTQLFALIDLENFYIDGHSRL